MQRSALDGKAAGITHSQKALKMTTLFITGAICLLLGYWLGYWYRGEEAAQPQRAPDPQMSKICPLCDYIWESISELSAWNDDRCPQCHQIRYSSFYDHM
jgi:hypothetical protein